MAFLARRSRRLGLFVALNHHGRGVGNLFASLDQNALANQLSDHEALRLVGVLVLGVVALANGQRLDDLANKEVQTVALAGAHRNNLCKAEVPGQRVDQRQQMVLGDEIDLGEQQKDRAVELADQAEEELVLAGPVGALAFGGFWTPRSQSRDLGHPGGRFRSCFQLHSPRRIHQYQHHIAGFQCFVDLLQHPPVEVRAGLVDAGSIDKDDLRRRMHALARRNLDHPGDAIAGSLRLGGDDGDLFAGQGVEQCAFTGVRPAENGDKSRFQRVFRLLTTIIADFEEPGGYHCVWAAKAKLNALFFARWRWPMRGRCRRSSRNGRSFVFC